eukprot:TRINITY_DN6818_c1_g1_i1.p1 TRINITY_DN6818_c1_g1~~TRINITY_DN6818_c1_g1_i1.p1  ORF type:complete len:175 (+),score=79.94 TRINITY_DN6818_c1_g1_i1:290-814(+)
MFPMFPNMGRSMAYSNDSEEDEDELDASDDEWSEEEFQKELNKYKKVRSSDYKVDPPTLCSEEKEEESFPFPLPKEKKKRDSPLISAKKEQSSSNISSGKEEVDSSRIEKDETESLSPSSSFYSQLKESLLPCYDEESCEKITREFKKLHEEYLNSLSLDDIERLAIQMQTLST